MNELPWKKTFCQNLLHLRKNHRLSQAQMSEIIGIGISRLRQIESGTFPAHLNASHLCRIADYFNLATDALFFPLNEDIYDRDFCPGQHRE